VSVLKRLDRPQVRAVVEPLTQAGHLARPAICDLEIGYSARNAAECDDLVRALGAFELVETTAQHITRSLQVQRLLAARSQRGRKIPDLLVAAAAEAFDLVVLHYDADFDLISAVTGQRNQRVAPAGTSIRPTAEWPSLVTVRISAPVR
jgi:predicted nucleic acid-binding protein